MFSMAVRRIVSIFIGTALLLYVGYLCLLYFWQRSMIYPGTENRVASTPPPSVGMEVIRLSTSAGDIEALFLPATDASTVPSKPLLIYGHGNGEVTDFWVTALDGFRERGIGVLLVEYPGYGRSGGTPSERSIRIAMDAAYDRLASDPRVDRTRILGFGQSLGGGAICLLAQDWPLRALILESTFPSLDIFAASYWAPSFLLRDRLNSLATVARFAGPVLVIHGRQDQLIPWQQGQRLAAASAHATFRLYDCGHGCWDPEHVPFWQDALPFLKSAGMLDSALP
jgi:pimeloyl-ACP methyl ester carboxylesterase